MIRWIKIQRPRLACLALFCALLSGQGGRPYERAVEDGPSHNGETIEVDLPPEQQEANIPAPADGLGLCVFASMQHAARWHNIRSLFGVLHKVRRGGGWPEKVEQVIKDNAPGSEVVQYLGNDLSFIERELAKGKMVCVTYGYSERYQNGLRTIYHMVNIVKLSKTQAAILDNNFVCTRERPNRYEWMSRDEFHRRWVHPKGQGWAWSFVAPPPPPVPHN